MMIRFIFRISNVYILKRITVLQTFYERKKCSFSYPFSYYLTKSQSVKKIYSGKVIIKIKNENKKNGINKR